MGYSKIRYSSSDVHFFLQDEGLIPSLVQVPYGIKKQLSKMTSTKGEIQAIINCSYFNNIDPLGRNQGELSHGTIDQKAGKVNWDYVITKDGQHVIGAFNSWDYPDAQIGFTCAVVLIKDGVEKQDVSTYLTTSTKYTTKQPITAFGVLSDGRAIMLVVEGRNSNDTGLSGSQIRTLVKKYYPTVKHLVMLDGGGSSEMIVNGKIMNYLSDGLERYMTNGLAFVKAKQPVITNTKYAVVHGSYDTIEQANAERDRLIALGFEAIVREL